ncbi:MAG TPA: hypothetical protein PKH39_17785 [Woeseiaceae bacterium]|nr:hypothetical protein [Woeseiaceae bacterium]
MIDQILSDGPLWVVWIAQFIAIEVPALFNKKDGDTWSEVLRYIFGFSKRAGDIQSHGMRARRVSFYAVSAWFIAHISGWV